MTEYFIQWKQKNKANIRNSWSSKYQTFGSWSCRLLGIWRPLPCISTLDVINDLLVKESYTAIPFYKRTPRPNSPSERLTYQGSNRILYECTKIRSLYCPSYCRCLVVTISWNGQQMVAYCSWRSFQRWSKISSDVSCNLCSHSSFSLAATFAGIGFGNAGVHLCVGY